MKYEEYKDSGVEWIGEVPSHWEVCRIKDVLKNGSDSIKIGPFGSSLTGKVGENLGYKVYGQWNIVGCDFNAGTNTVDSETFKKLCKSYRVVGGDILISMMGTIGKCAVIPENIQDGIMDSHVVKIRLNRTKMTTDFFEYFYDKDKSNVVYSQLQKVKGGSIMDGLNSSIIKNLTIVVPPVNEQIEIIKAIKDKIRNVEVQIYKANRRISLLEELKQSIITDAVTKGLNPNAPMKDSGVEWIGEVPEHWEIRKIKSLSIVKRGASPRPIEDPKYFNENGDYAWVRIADVSNSERYLEKTTQTLSALGASLSVKREPGDIFISIAGTVGKPIITHIKCCIHDGFVWFPYLKQNSEYLYYIFMSGQPYLGLGKMGTQLNLNTDTIGDIKIPVPPLAEQQTIATHLDKECEKIAAQISKANRRIELLNELKQSIITEAVTGKIKVC